MGNTESEDELLYPSQAARRLRVHPDTLTWWNNKNLIAAEKTPRGHRRYRASEVERVRKEREQGTFGDPLTEARRELSGIAADYPAWHCFLSEPAGRAWAVLTEAGGELAGTTLDADTPSELRVRIVRTYSAILTEGI